MLKFDLSRNAKMEITAEGLQRCATQRQLTKVDNQECFTPRSYPQLQDNNFIDRSQKPNKSSIGLACTGLTPQHSFISTFAYWRVLARLHFYFHILKSAPALMNALL